MPQPGLDQLLIEPCSIILLSLQGILVLEGELSFSAENRNERS
jgi:hypothetical protein